VQNQAELGEGSVIPTDPHHTPTIIQPSPQPQKTQKPRKPKRKDTQIPQSNDPTNNVADEVVHKELGDSLVRASTTTFSLEAEQDSGNITKTRSKATPNESSFLGTTSGGGPRGNTLKSYKDRLKLNELMELCTNLQNMVLDLEKTKTTQANEITTRVESSRDEESLGKDASKQGRINVIDADDDITLVSVQDDADKEIFDVDALNGEEVFVAGQNENVVEEVVDATQVSTATTTVTITTEEITLAQALEALKTSKPKVKWIIFQEPAEIDEEERLAREKVEKEKEVYVALTEELDDIQAKIEADHKLAQRLQAEEQEEFYVEEKAKLFQQLLEQRRKYFAAKSAEDKWNKPPTQAQQRKIMSFKRVNTFVDFKTDLVEGSSKRAGEELEQESTKNQKVDEDKDIAELQSLMEVIPDEEEVAIDVVPLATKPPTIVDWKIHKEGKKNYFQIIRADGSSKMYLVFSQLLKSVDREDLVKLYKPVKAKYGSTRTVGDMDLLLWVDLKTMLNHM
ncbi:hypothetical protein Tco_1477710, partial [Tanacetum coccineum]